MNPPEPEDDKTRDEEIRQDLDDASVDAAFADIVAMFRADRGPDGEVPAAGVPAGDAPVEDLPPADPHVPGAGASSVDTAAIDEIFEARRRRIEREVDAAVDGPGGGHFVPPEPAPLPQLDVFTLLAWGAALLGPVLIVIAAFTGGLVPRWVIGAAVAATIGGFVLLVSRLPRRGEADPDDDGAVV